MAQKKKWFVIVGPKIFDSKEVGEITCDEDAKIIGKTITVNAKDLIGDFKKSHINIKLVINEVTDGKALTNIIGYEISRAYIQRFIHKGLSSIELIKEFRTSDNLRIRVRCLATANGKIQLSKKHLIRDRMIKEFESIIGNTSLETLIFLSVKNSIQKTINTKLKKTHPLRFVEIKKIKVLGQ